MNRDWYKPLLWLMWLALPSAALNYWRAWDQLPMRMAVHFDANSQPNGWTSRAGAAQVGLSIMGVLLIFFTIGGLIARARKPEAAWPMLFVFYVVLGIVWYGNNSIVNWNLRSNDRAPHSELMPLEFPSKLDS